MQQKKGKIINFIGSQVKIGKNVKIWHFAYVGNKVEIGNNVKIGSLAHIDYGVKIGNHTKIEGLAYIPPLSVIGNHVFIGPSAVLTNDPYPMSKKMVGVVVEDRVVIGARAVIKAGVRIGQKSVVGMGSVVTKNVLPNTVVAGVPAKYIYSKDKYNKKLRKWNKNN